MKRSSQVPATLIIALAAGLTTDGCSSSYRQCEDASGRLYEDSVCSSGFPGVRWVTIQRGGFGGGGGGGGSFGGGFGG